jgi:glycerol-3-phosphate acyltransferase PlsY
MDLAALAGPAASLVAGYLIGSIPFAYVIVRLVTGEDVTAHGTGNVGSMNVRRATGSWGWFVVAMFCDGFKGLIPVAIVKTLIGLAVLVPFGVSIDGGLTLAVLAVPAMVLGTVLGHNYSAWMALIQHRFSRTGKGLATGGGALLAYDWRYFVAVIVVALLTIAVTRYMMAGQVIAAFTLPATALLLRSPDWPFALFMGLLVYAAHHNRFIGLLQGREPKLYIDDRMGPRG